MGIKIASIQYEFSNELTKEERIKKAERFIDQSKGANLIILPELWNFGFHSMFDPDINIEQVRDASETIKGETIFRLSQKAKELNAYIISGSILEKRDEDFYNTLALIDPNGKIVNTFSKIHLTNYLGYQEAKFCKPGKITTVKTELGILGFAICYDLRFPELFRKMVVNEGVEIIIFIAAFAMGRLENYIHLCRARAIENQCYFVSCSGVGKDRGHDYLGYSTIIDPRGHVISGSGTNECIVRGEINIEDMYKYRRVMPNLKNITFSV